MKWTKEKIIEVTMWKCDHCDFTTEGNKGRCGVSPIMKCWICNKDCCRKHRKFYLDDLDDSDYPRGFYACPDCQEEAERAWKDAVEIAGRYDDILDVARDCIDGYRFQVNFDRGIEHKPFDWFGRTRDED